MPRRLRIAVLLVALAAMLGIATVSASPLHNHLTGSAAGCDICFSAHLPAVETPAVHVLHDPQTAEPLIFTSAVVVYQALDGESSSSRGPPAFLA